MTPPFFVGQATTALACLLGMKVQAGAATLMLPSLGAGCGVTHPEAALAKIDLHRE
jgi:hypothetical protein